MTRVRAVHEGGDHRAARLLELEEHDVVGAAPLAEHEVGPKADAADADDLVDDVHDGVAGQHPAPLGRHGQQVVVQGRHDEVLVTVGDAGDEGRVLDDAPHPVALLGQPGQRPVAGAPPSPARRVPDLLTEPAVVRRLAEPVDVQPLERPRQQRQPGQVAHLRPVGGDAAPDGVREGGLGAAVLPSGDPHARHEPAQVPLPRARVRLVEVVEVEDEVALGRGVEAEVAQVGVTADDRSDARGGQ